MLVSYIIYCSTIPGLAADIFPSILLLYVFLRARYLRIYDSMLIRFAISAKKNDDDKYKALLYDVLWSFSIVYLSYDIA